METIIPSQNWANVILNLIKENEEAEEPLQGKTNESEQPDI